jgi:hypothetical protein
MSGYNAAGRNDPIVTRDRWPGESRTNASALCAIYRVTPGARETVARFDNEESAHAALVQLQAEQQAIIDAHNSADSKRAVRELDLLPEKFRQQTEALLVEHRAAVEHLHAEQQAEVARVKAIRPVQVERYEVVQF